MGMNRYGLWPYCSCNRGFENLEGNYYSVTTFGNCDRLSLTVFCVPSLRRLYDQHKEILEMFLRSKHMILRKLLKSYLSAFFCKPFRTLCISIRRGNAFCDIPSFFVLRILNWRLSIFCNDICLFQDGVVDIDGPSRHS